MMYSAMCFAVYGTSMLDGYTFIGHISS